ncbi:IS66 family transposase [Archangium violaceum]|uniref:IS66 family transposase n=1 Tax=Archangium violaceum TaxID=83451 RepID=UPI002B2E3346|nr:IS66 family transposase [Archangium gephyra]
MLEVMPRNARLHIAELEAQVSERDARIAELEAQVKALTRRVAELEAQLKQNSTNSSKPPSSDPPGVRRTPKVPKGGRPGGQPGHEFHERELLPPEQVDRFMEVPAPERCTSCDGKLEGGQRQVLRHQMVEIPPLKPLVTELRCHVVECAHCGTLNRAILAPEAAGHVFGERLSAMVCLLVGKYRLSKRLVRDALSDLLGVRLSLGAIGNREQEMSKALSAPVAQAEQYVRDQDAANLDETGWYEGKANGHHRRAWLWLAATALVAVFRISSSHGSEVAKALLGEDFAGFLTTDRWSAYDWYDTALRQLCWSHLTRDFQGFIDRGGEGAPIGQVLMEERNRMFKWWHRVRDGTLSREDFERRMREVEQKVGLLLRQAAVCAEEKTAGTAAKILQLEEAMWTFVHVEGLEPTNNFAERLIRPCVMYRKTSFGTQSPEGSRFVERILTAVTTLDLQQRNVLEYLTDLLYAHRRGLPLPSLLPFTTTAQAVPPA